MLSCGNSEDNVPSPEGRIWGTSLKPEPIIALLHTVPSPPQSLPSLPLAVVVHNATFARIAEIHSASFVTVARITEPEFV